MNQPPPPDKTSSFLEILHRDMAQRAAEHDQVRRLRREIEVKKLQMELADLSAPHKPVKTQRRLLGFYEQQITAWFNRLPPEAKNAPRTMEELINLLEGRTPGRRPHAPEVAKTLRSLRWSRRRCWKSDGEARRLWYPPLANGG